MLGSGSYSDKAHALAKDGEVHVCTLKAEGTGTFYGESCTFEVHVHEANGKLVVERGDFTCV